MDSTPERVSSDVLSLTPLSTWQTASVSTPSARSDGGESRLFSLLGATHTFIIDSSSGVGGHSFSGFDKRPWDPRYGHVWQRLSEN